MNPDDFLKLLTLHDWFYMYSDDPAAHRKGNSEAVTIRTLRQSYPELNQVYEAFKAGSNSPISL